MSTHYAQGSEIAALTRCGDQVGVVVDLDGDGVVDVGVSHLGSQHLREHRDNALQQLDASVVPVEPDQLPQPENIQRRRALHRLTARDPPTRSTPPSPSRSTSTTRYDEVNVNVNDGMPRRGFHEFPDTLLN